METKIHVNTFNQRVKVQCASCLHKLINNDGTRECSLMQILVKQHDCCQKWELMEGLDRAGLGRGVVKDKQHLIYALMVCIEKENELKVKN